MPFPPVLLSVSRTKSQTHGAAHKDTNLHDKSTEHTTGGFTGLQSWSGHGRIAPLQLPPSGIPPKNPKSPMAHDGPWARLVHIFSPFLSAKPVLPHLHRPREGGASRRALGGTCEQSRDLFIRDSSGVATRSREMLKGKMKGPWEAAAMAGSAALEWYSHGNCHLHKGKRDRKEI